MAPSIEDMIKPKSIYIVVFILKTSNYRNPQDHLVKTTLMQTRKQVIITQESLMFATLH